MQDRDTLNRNGAEIFNPYLFVSSQNNHHQQQQHQLQHNNLQNEINFQQQNLHIVNQNQDHQQQQINLQHQHQIPHHFYLHNDNQNQEYKKDETSNTMEDKVESPVNEFSKSYKNDKKKENDNFANGIMAMAMNIANGNLDNSGHFGLTQTHQQNPQQQQHQQTQQKHQGNIVNFPQFNVEDFATGHSNSQLPYSLIATVPSLAQNSNLNNPNLIDASENCGGDLSSTLALMAGMGTQPAQSQLISPASQSLMSCSSSHQLISSVSTQQSALQLESTQLVSGGTSSPILSLTSPAAWPWYLNASSTLLGGYMPQAVAMAAAAEVNSAASSAPLQTIPSISSVTTTNSLSERVEDLGGSGLYSGSMTNLTFPIGIYQPLLQPISTSSSVSSSAGYSTINLDGNNNSNNSTNNSDNNTSGISSSLSVSRSYLTNETQMLSALSTTHTINDYLTIQQQQNESNDAQVMTTRTSRSLKASNGRRINSTSLQMELIKKMTGCRPENAVNAQQSTGSLPLAMQSMPTIPSIVMRPNSCNCPKCVEMGNKGLKNDKHNCHIPGCHKIYSKSSHLKAHLRWHNQDRPTNAKRNNSNTKRIDVN